MTKHEAWQRAHSLWAGPLQPGVVCLRQKKTSPRYLVGARGLDGAMIVRGVSDTSWEDAFANAAYGHRWRLLGSGMLQVMP